MIPFVMALNERECFTEKPEQRPARYQCPRCHRTNEYQIRWVRRTRKPQPPRGADDRDKALFAKLKDHLVRVDDDVVCQTCGKKFEIPSHRALIFLEELQGLPRDEEQDAEESAAAPEPAAQPEEPQPKMADGRPLPKRFQRGSSGWK